jgi:hypothetical protein
VQAANATSVDAPADVDEWIVSGLTMEKSVSIYSTLVAEYPADYKYRSFLPCFFFSLDGQIKLTHGSVTDGC